jgi:hypothetical protein
VGTVVRACQSLGFKGFQAAKIALAQDLLPLDERPQEDISNGDEPLEVLAKLARSSGEALRRATASVGAADLARAIELLADARSVDDGRPDAVVGGRAVGLPGGVVTSSSARCRAVSVVSAAT